MSIARSMRATGKACPALVGQKAHICEQNSTRDVTALLDKSGLSLQVPRETLVSCLQFCLILVGGCYNWFVLGCVTTCDFKKCLGPVPQVYNTSDGHVIELPILLPSSWLKLLLAEYPFLLCGGLGHDFDQELKSFWRCYGYFQPGHACFQKDPADLASTLPLLLHGDEGRYLKKGNFMICTLETVLGNDPNRKNTGKHVAAMMTLC